MPSYSRPPDYVGEIQALRRRIEDLERAVTKRERQSSVDRGEILISRTGEDEVTIASAADDLVYLGDLFEILEANLRCRSLDVIAQAVSAVPLEVSAPVGATTVLQQWRTSGVGGLTAAELGETGWLLMRQHTNASPPSAPVGTFGKIFMRDNGAGKMQFCARFPTGVVQVIATEP